jgi:Fe-S-cluster containining protein
MGSNCQICSFKCWGIDNYDGSCCTLEDRDWIMGPSLDWEIFLEKLSSKIGRNINFSEVFYTYEEGSRLFPDRPVWKDPNNFPAFRVDLNSPRKSCIFYNQSIKSCMVYEIRPETCRNYSCNYLRENQEAEKEEIKNIFPGEI